MPLDYAILWGGVPTIRDYRFAAIPLPDIGSRTPTAAQGRLRGEKQKYRASIRAFMGTLLRRCYRSPGIIRLDIGARTPRVSHAI